MEFDCHSNWPRSLIQMKANDPRILQTPNIVTLTNTLITDTYYAMNSIVSLTPFQGVVNINSANFNRNSICGSVVKSEFIDLKKPQIKSYINYLYLSPA